MVVPPATLVMQSSHLALPRGQVPMPSPSIGILTAFLSMNIEVGWSIGSPITLLEADSSFSQCLSICISYIPWCNYVNRGDHGMIIA